MSNRYLDKPELDTYEKWATYNAWLGAKSRCYNRNNLKYESYGGRGIRMCDEWLNNFEAFLVCIGPKPSPKHLLDRIDTNGNYEPGNVRWATYLESANNRRNTPKWKQKLKSHHFTR